jgi:ATP-binding cassette subfamily B protein
VEIDDRELKGSWLWHMRQQTSWLDPNVQIWNQSFLDNLLYGADGDSDPPIADALDKAALREVLERLPQGLQTPLGEGGKLVSGGEGQRVRLGRALMRKRARLVLLDEPFRGLERAVRRELLAAVRKWWRGATLLWVSHDIAATRDFPRVIVIDQGRVVEDGAPEELIARPGSRYASLLQSYQRVQREQWSRAEWRRLWLRRGQLSEEEPG